MGLLGKGARVDADGREKGTVVLVVDGERFVRESLRRLLASEAEVVVAATPEEGLAVLGAREVDVVLADYRMGATDGVQFLRSVRTAHPTVTRVLMSGFLDPSIFTRFLSSGLVSAFIAKPWEEAPLRAKLAHLLATRSLLRSKELLDVVNALGSLPTLPSLFQELVIAVEDRKPMKEIALLLERDSSVAARLIHVANSAAFGHREVTSVADAAVLLGATLLKDLVLTTELAHGTRWSEGQRRELERVFQHSFAVNRVLPVAHRLLYKSALEAAHASVGIVHDIGKLLVLRSFPERYEATVSAAQAWKSDGFWRAEIEAGHQGSTHAEIGGWLLDFWDFPRAMVEVAVFHHQPDQGPQEGGPLLAVTALANRLVHRAEAQGPDAPGDLAEIGAPRMSQEEEARLMRLVRQELEGVRKRFRLSVS